MSEVGGKQTELQNELRSKVESILNEMLDVETSIMKDGFKEVSSAVIDVVYPAVAERFVTTFGKMAYSVRKYEDQMKKTTETIRRQTVEIAQLRSLNRKLIEKLRELLSRGEVEKLLQQEANQSVMDNLDNLQDHSKGSAILPVKTIEGRDLIREKKEDGTPVGHEKLPSLGDRLRKGSRSVDKQSHYNTINFDESRKSPSIGTPGRAPPFQINVDLSRIEAPLKDGKQTIANSQ